MFPIPIRHLKLSDQENITRTPKAEVYKHILEDFDFAAANLPTEWDGANDARITKGGALAMKARAALSQKRLASGKRCS